MTNEEIVVLTELLFDQALFLAVVIGLSAGAVIALVQYIQYRDSRDQFQRYEKRIDHLCRIVQSMSASANQSDNPS